MVAIASEDVVSWHCCCLTQAGGVRIRTGRQSLDANSGRLNEFGTTTPGSPLIGQFSSVSSDGVADDSDALVWTRRWRGSETHRELWRNGATEVEVQSAQMAELRHVLRKSSV